MNTTKGMLLLAVSVSVTLSARDLRREVSLRVGWRFEIGDNKAYAEPEFDDSEWERIHVPDSWEDQGFPGYDGYAWYRIRLKLPDRLIKKSLYLKLGYIDDVDEVYINGKYLNGSGAFPPEYRNLIAACTLPKDSIKTRIINTAAPVKIFSILLIFRPSFK